PSPIPTPSAPQCDTQILDYGQKGALATVARGTSSDVRILPRSPDSWIGVAYSDPGALSLKFSWTNGKGFQTEVVSGDGNASSVKLGFFANGVPIIIWAQNGYLKAAFRTAPLGSSGTWSASVLETAGSADAKYSAVELAISSHDDLLISFVSKTQRGWRARFGSCLTPCGSPLDIKLATAIQDLPSRDQKSTGAAWITTKGGNSYPALTYSLEHSTVYSVYDSDSWRHIEISNSPSLTSSIFVEPSKKAEPVRIALQNTQSGLQVLEINPACVFGTPSCILKRQIITSDPRIGNRWLKLLRDDAGKFHLVANEGNIGISYFNSSKKDFTKAWNSPTALDSSGFSNLSQGGVVFGDHKKSILISYGVNASPYDLKLGILADPGAPSGTVPSMRSYSSLIVDTTGGLQLSARNSQRKLMSADMSATGDMGVAYVDYSAGSSLKGKLSFAYLQYDSSNNSSNWRHLPLSFAPSPQQPVFRFDSLGRPWVGYFDSTQRQFYLATHSVSEAAPWTLFESPFNPGSAAPLPAANETALVFETSTGEDIPVLIVIDNSTPKALRAARLDPQTGNWSWVGTGKINLLGDGGATHLSADVDFLGNIGVSYYDLTSHTLMFSSYNPKFNEWRTPRAIGAAFQGAGAHLRLHPQTLEPMVSFYDRVSGELLFSHCKSSIEECSTTAPWEVTLVDAASGVEGIPFESETLLAASLDFDAQGAPLIFYTRGQATQGALMRAHRISPDTGGFELSAVFEGVNTHLAGTPPIHFALSGWNATSSARPFFGFGAFFVGPGNWLYGTRCGE
ncbi:hypothetical protein WDW86_04715, partial [Bdellovibrionota bacterium FG-2]